MGDLIRLQDALIEAQRWKEAKTVTAAIATITELQAKVEELTVENRGSSKQMWAAQYCNPTEDLRLAKLKVEELEDMLQSAIERESCNERRIEQLKTRLKASLQECDYCGAALKQEGE